MNGWYLTVGVSVLCLVGGMGSAVAQEVPPPPRIAGWQAGQMPPPPVSSAPPATAVEPAPTPAVVAPVPVAAMAAAPVVAEVPPPSPPTAASGIPPPAPPTSVPVLPPRPSSLTTASSGPADDRRSRFGFLLGTALEFGGDEVGYLTFEDGTEYVHAGEGITLKAGFYWRQFRKHGFELRATAGYKFRLILASNGDVEMSRIVLEPTLGYLAPGGFRFGVGPSFHRSIKATAELDNDSVEQRYENANGWVAEIGWRWITARYTQMDYREDHFLAADIDANSYGIGVVWDF